MEEDREHLDSCRLQKNVGLKSDSYGEPLTALNGEVI